MVPIISVQSNVAAVSKGLSELEYEQLPFALARTVTGLARKAQDAEKKAMPSVFDKPTPFTVNSVGMTSAKKALPIASVFIKDQAAQYLAPYEYGGTQFLGAKPADLVPVNARANSYGNLPRGSIKQLLARPDCFRGKYKGVDGIWQRPYVRPNPKVRGRSKVDKLANTTGGLRLLVAFYAPASTTKRLNFGNRAQILVERHFDAEFAKNLRQAVATAKL